jgi:hypothetical protein
LKKKIRAEEHPDQKEFGPKKKGDLGINIPEDIARDLEEEDMQESSSRNKYAKHA